MKNIFCKSILAVSIFSVITLISTSTTFAASDPHKDDHPVHWSYSGDTSAEHWGELDDTYALCQNGKEQSPIDINTATQTVNNQLALNYQPEKVSVINNGHTIQGNLKAGQSFIELDSSRFDLLQFHFHTPSEESIDGKRFDMVGHFVHSSPDKEIAVIAVLFEIGEENTTLKPIFENLPKEEGATFNPNSAIDLQSLMPTTKNFYSFMGSLTTPPCSEGVHWLVLKTPVSLSKEQFDAFKAIFPFNARPLQPLNDREIIEVVEP